MWNKGRGPAAPVGGPDTSWLLLFVVAMLTLALWFRGVLAERYREGYRAGLRGVAALQQRERPAGTRP